MRIPAFLLIFGLKHNTQGLIERGHQQHTKYKFDENITLRSCTQAQTLEPLEAKDRLAHLQMVSSTSCLEHGRKHMQQVYIRALHMPGGVPSRTRNLLQHIYGTCW